MLPDLTALFAPHLLLLLQAGAPCTPDWIPTFGGEPGVEPGVSAMVVHDDGSGPALFVAGGLNSAGGVPLKGIAKWDGASWSALGTAVPMWIAALTVFDDGSGPALYAGGSFTEAGGVPAASIARWDGSSWSPVGSGLTGGGVFALNSFDDGTGPGLFAGGSFTEAGGLLARGLAKWDGSVWSEPGGGSDGRINALAVHDDGSGPALYVGGNFNFAGGVAARNVAKWDG